MTSPTIEAVTTSAAPAPVGPYNQAVKAGGVLYCSGQIALDPATGAMVGGGDVEAGTPVTEEYLMALERRAFCELVAHPKSQERIMAMMSTGKPLRN